MTKRNLAALLVAWAAACTVPSQTEEDLPWVPRPGEAPIAPPCNDSTRLAHTAAADSIIPPQALRIFIPPLPLPPAVRGKRTTATFAVDSVGKFTPDSITMTTLGDNAYDKKVRAQLARFVFRPALLVGAGCSVSGKAEFFIDFGR